MRSFIRLLVVCCLLAAVAGPAIAQSGMTPPPMTVYGLRQHYDPPPVAVSRAGDALKLTFPTTTIPYTVSFRCFDQILTSSMIQQHPDVFRWTSPTELTISQQGLAALRVPAIDKDLWVWGQLEDGNPLLQQTGVF